MVSEIQLRIAKKYIEDEIPDLTGQVDLWVQSGAGSASIEQKQLVRSTSDGLEARPYRVTLLGFGVLGMFMCC